MTKTKMNSNYYNNSKNNNNFAHENNALSV